MGKQLFRNTIKGFQQEKPCFIPFINRLASRITNIPLKDIAWEATNYTYSLESACRLLKAKVICNSFDSTIEGESLGCSIVWPELNNKPYLVSSSDLIGITPENFLNSGRIPVIAEATKRLKISLGREAAIVGVVTGPCTLTRIINSENPENISQIGKLIISYVRTLCELKVDGILFREDGHSGDFLGELLQNRDSYGQIYRTIFNIVKTYNALSLLTVNSLPVEKIEQVVSLLKVNGIILFGRKINEADLTFLQDVSRQFKISIGLPIPFGSAGQEELGHQLDLYEFFRKKKLGSFFYTSNEEIPEDISLEILHDIVEKLQ